MYLEVGWIFTCAQWWDADSLSSRWYLWVSDIQNLCLCQRIKKFYSTEPCAAFSACPTNLNLLSKVSYFHFVLKTISLSRQKLPNWQSNVMTTHTFAKRFGFRFCTRKRHLLLNAAENTKLKNKGEKNAA